MSLDISRSRTLTTPTWLNVRTVLGLAIFCFAVLGGQYLMRASATTVLVWAAAEDLPQDTLLTSQHLRAVAVRLPEELQGNYVLSSESLNGATLTTAVLEGELVPRGWLGEADPTAGRSMTIPVTPEHAVGGDLQPGDRVDVFATFNAGDARARTTLLARDVEILDVVTAGGFALDEEAAIGINVAVSSDEAARLALAIRTAELDVVRILGGGPPASTTTVRAGDFP